jgi:hypothetical protein
MKIYHFLSILLAGAVGLIIYIVGEYGSTDLNTCFIKSGSKGQLLEFLPLFLNFPIIMILLLISVAVIDNNYESVILNIMFVSFTLGITLTLATIFSLLGTLKVLKPNVVEAGVLIGALSGFIVSLSRLANKNIFIAIRDKLKKGVRVSLIQKSMFNSSDTQPLRSRNKSVYDLSGLFFDVTVKVI